MSEHGEISSTGFMFLYIGFACMLVSTFAFYFGGLRVDVEYRRFHNLTFLITGFASVAYMTMAFGFGGTHVGDRHFLFARYLDWLVTTPLLLLDLGLLAGAHQNELIFLIGADIMMVVAGVLGGLYDNGLKWIFFVYGCIFFGFIIMSLYTGIAKNAERFGEDVKSKFATLANMTVVLWIAYPIVWAAAEGANVVSVDVEVVAYMVLDIIAKCGFGFILLADQALLEKVESGNTSLLGE
eukprot:Clim_evm55s142 gene=Clim_evmTU55s142